MLWLPLLLRWPGGPSHIRGGGGGLYVYGIIINVRHNSSYNINRFLCVSVFFFLLSGLVLMGHQGERGVLNH